jgi:archaellum component FlaC
MAADSDGDTQRQLGILIGQMAGVQQQLEDIKERQDRSDESRKGLQGRLDIVGADVAEIKNDMRAQSTATEAIRKDVADMKPEIELVRDIKGKAGMAALVLAAIGAVLAWLVGNFWEPIRTLAAKIFH